MYGSLLLGLVIAAAIVVVGVLWTRGRGRFGTFAVPGSAPRLRPAPAPAAATGPTVPPYIETTE